MHQIKFTVNLNWLVYTTTYYCVLNTCFADSNKDPYAFEGLINETIEGIRDDLPEPIVIENLTITVPEDIDILT